MPPDARVNYERWVGMGEVGSLVDPGEISALRTKSDEQGVLVDAVFGTGLARPLEEDLRLAILDFLSRVPICFLHSVAIDVPSGVCADSGRALVGSKGFPLQWSYDLVVTFHRLRVGHLLGPVNARRTIIKDIGLNKSPHGALTGMSSLFSKWGKAIQEGVDPSSLIDVQAEIAAANRHDEICAAKVELVDGFDVMVDKAQIGTGHKYSHGHALILSGPSGRGGAARLAARGALRIGAGVATVGCPPDAVVENAARLEAVMLRPVADAAALADILQDQRINALCLGPGLGTGPREAALLAVALGGPLFLGSPPPPSPPREGEGGHLGDRSEAVDEALPLPFVERGQGRGAALCPTVLDADALTLLSRDPDLIALLHDRCVLTPHAGEFARLFPDIAAKLAEPAMRGPAYSKVDATREAAARAGCVVLFKGADTVIAAPDGRCSINSAAYDRSAPWLATAGSGDVLAGFITGLLARGFAPMHAAETAAWLHVECARSFGPGLIAEDLPEELPKVFRALGL
jgi:NAD(P)H-hydrate repair Nnr-like enzyme with NAD(P)H-hydrate dehydratase domain